MECDAIVAGAGIWGCVVARRLAESGRKVLVLEKRGAVGGNVRCETDPATGIEVHVYGSHIFHTRDRAVWEFVSRFTGFNCYRHKVLASWRGKTYFLPVGLALVNSFFGKDLKPAEMKEFMADPANSSAIFDAFFRGYTSKQWGRPPEEVDPSVIRRVAVRSNYDVGYFGDPWQGIPSDGYNAVFERMLDHPGIEVECGRAFVLDEWAGSGLKAYYSGPLDELFGYRFGCLPWRTLRFETERLDVADFQGTSVVNYPDVSVPYTRIHEFKHYHPEDEAAMAAAGTVIMREYPAQWKQGDEPYYPVDTPESRELAGRYRSEAAKLPWLVVGGRLGDYRYNDMDKSVAAALAVEL